MGTNGRNSPLFYTATLVVNTRPIKFTRHGLTSDSHSKIKIQKYNNRKTGNDRIPECERQQNKIRGKDNSKYRLDGTKQQLELLITTRYALPLLGLDWMGKKEKSLESDKITTDRMKHNNTET